MLALSIILGAIVLLFGRKLFWAFVAIAGFLIGVEVAGSLMADQSVGLQILVGIGLGVAGAIVAVVAERVGFALAGLFAVGYLSVIAGGVLMPDLNPLVWFIAGGLCGAILAAVLMDRAIIVLSSFVGATAIVAPMKFSPNLALVATIGLIIVGIAFQWRNMRYERPKEG